jgi:predicted nucleic acid-binding protein
MPDKVVDASIVVALAFGEPRAAEARELTQGIALHAPSLLPYEICSAALRKTRDWPEQIDAIAASLGWALGLKVELNAVPPYELLALALETGLTIYDASYLWVARNLGCELVTFDQRLARAARVERR